MSWTTPKQNWTPNEIVSAAAMNDIGANLAFLKSGRARATATINPANTTSAVFSSAATLTLTTHGGALLVGASFSAWHSASGTIFLDIALDGVRLALAGTSGSLEIRPPANPAAATLSCILTPVNAGARTVSLQWRTSSATASIGVGQLWALEL